MTLLLTGISNENEFYTNYYMSEILETDLKEITSKWRSESEMSGAKAPPDKLKSISDAYFRFKNALKRESDPDVCLALQRDFSSILLKVFGYKQDCVNRVIENGKIIPLLAEVRRTSGEPELWILEAYDVFKTSASFEYPLTITFSINQFQSVDDPANQITDESLENIITKQIFSQTEPPRWVIIVSDSQVILIDRSKWNDQRLLRFDLEEILARREASTLAATCLLLHHDNITSKQGQSLLDALDEKSHKHSQAVTQNLKYALQQCIEIIGNEVIHYLRTTSKEKIYEREIEKEITVESLRFMYRLLFILYIESREELGYAPINSDAYRLGYSFESLRDLEVLELTEEEARTTYYIHDSIKLLFDLIYNGYPEHLQLQDQYNQLFISYTTKESIQENSDAIRNFDFDLFPLRSHLFEPAKTPLLNKVRLRNAAMLQVLKLMSLSKAKGNKQRSGRISYAQLGINQLGAVYEALLCFKGFFAEEDLYEVQPEPKKGGRSTSDGDENESDFEEEVDGTPLLEKSKSKGEAKNTRDALEIAYLIPKDELDKYSMGERVFDEQGKQKFYSRGSFIYRLAGRDRQKSASYYTPEVLTHCLVKYSLKELLKEKSADDILTLKICEPAMGSAAFLNECVNQLADAYLIRKQNELNKRIPHDEYVLEKQKVKMFIADRNVFGVDLNPVAVELAEVSLWLNSIHEGAFVPWFGMQLVCGNSLVGARRQTFARDSLSMSKRANLFWYETEPERVMPGTNRRVDHIYHFLLPDPNMSKYDDKTVKELAKDHIKAIDSWRVAFCKPLTETEARTVLELSTRVDELWKQHSDKLRTVRASTTDPLSFFGREEKNPTELTLTEQKDELFKQEGLAAEISSSSAYSRLKFVMDYWCALWFWPILESQHLPSRAQFFADMSIILSNSSKSDNVSLENLIAENEHLKIVRALGSRYRFMHWELEFADVFEHNGGFDLVIGNPPWIKLEWEESAILGDKDPLFAVRKITATNAALLRKQTLEKFNMISDYFTAFEESTAAQSFLRAPQNYPLLRGVQTNSYKCFLTQGWMIANTNGTSAFVHPVTIFDEAKAAHLRKQAYARLKYHFQFRNELRLFPVHDQLLYSLNIYQNKISSGFVTISNLFHPKTIDACYEHDGSGNIPGIKTENQTWNMSGHRLRIVNIDAAALSLFANLYDGANAREDEAHLPAIYCTPLLSVLRKFLIQPERLEALSKDVIITEMWHETGAQKDQTIAREVGFPKCAESFVYSGPHFNLANPFSKCPRRICTSNMHYDSIDLRTINSSYLPRSNYKPACDALEYARRIPTAWSDSKVTDYYRIVCRKMMHPSVQRTLISAIIPPSVSHTNGAISLTLKNKELLLDLAAQFTSVPVDFFVKITGKKNLYPELLLQLPVIGEGPWTLPLRLRTLLLNCLTEHYSELWMKTWRDEYKSDSLTTENLVKMPQLFSVWSHEQPARTELLRRQLLLEIDVLVGLAMGFSFEEFLSIYQTQFPIMRQFDKQTFYDGNGQIVFTPNKVALPGVGVDRKLWNEIENLQSGLVTYEVSDDTTSSGFFERKTTYQAPFFSMNREHDYEAAWEAFSNRLGVNNSLSNRINKKTSSII